MVQHMLMKQQFNKELSDSQTLLRQPRTIPKSRGPELQPAAKILNSKLSSWKQFDFLSVPIAVSHGAGVLNPKPYFNIQSYFKSFIKQSFTESSMNNRHKLDGDVDANTHNPYDCQRDVLCG